MATLQSHINNFDSSLDDLPAWKRELILRKRANAKIHGGKPNVGGVSAPYSPLFSNSQRQNSLRSLQGQPQLSICSVQGAQEPLHTVCGHKENEKFSQLSVACDVGREAHDKSEDFLDCSHKVCDSGSQGRVRGRDTDMRGPATMLHKGPASLGGIGLGPERWSVNEEEEFEYGPGIVSRLKNRYLSLALREAKGRSTLRKYSSLEDLLDDGGRERGRQTQKERPSAGGAGGMRKESMKRARSMDSLAFRRSDSNEKVSKSLSPGALRNALGKEDIIIIESPPPPSENGVVQKGEGSISNYHKKTPLLEEEELPAPDTVKQVKQIFESSTTPSNRAPPRGAAAKVASYKAAQSSRKDGVNSFTKPPLKAKPVQLQQSKATTIESAKSSLKQVKTVVKSSPKSVLTLKTTIPSTEASGKKMVSSPPPINVGLTPITASVTSPQMMPEDHQPRLHSPPTPLPPSPTLSHKTNSSTSLKDDVEETNESERRVLQENEKNMKKSVESPIEFPSSGILQSSPPLKPQSTKLEPISKVPSPIGINEGGEGQEKEKSQDERIQSPSSVMDVVRAAEAKAPSPLGLKRSKLKEGGRHSQDNSPLVFNFSKRTDTPDYIENDGVDLSKRHFPYKEHEAGYVIMPGFDARRSDSSTDGDDGGDDDDEDDLPRPLLHHPPPPCNITFEGEGVIINGRSNLQRQPRTKKLEVSFDMPATSTFEYPSENCLSEDFDEKERVSSSSSSSSVSTGGLANYTPSKLHLTDSFELGISRSSAPHPPTPPKRNPIPEMAPPSLQDHVRPADESETVTWSAESVPDLLF